MPKKTVYRVKATPVVPASVAPGSGKPETAVPVAQGAPGSQRVVAKPQGTGELLLNFHPDKLVQGVVFAEILGSPRCRRGR